MKIFYKEIVFQESEWRIYRLLKPADDLTWSEEEPEEFILKIPEKKVLDLELADSQYGYAVYDECKGVMWNKLDCLCTGTEEMKELVLERRKEREKLQAQRIFYFACKEKMEQIIKDGREESKICDASAGEIETVIAFVSASGAAAWQKHYIVDLFLDKKTETSIKCVYDKVTKYEEDFLVELE